MPYGCIVVYFRPLKDDLNRVLLTVKVNLINYTGNVRTPTLDLNTEYLLFNSVVSTPGARYMCCNINISTWERLCKDTNTSKYTLS